LRKFVWTTDPTAAAEVEVEVALGADGPLEVTGDGSRTGTLREAMPVAPSLDGVGGRSASAKPLALTSRTSDTANAIRRWDPIGQRPVPADRWVIALSRRTEGHKPASSTTLRPAVRTTRRVSRVSRIYRRANLGSGTNGSLQWRLIGG
jgi:hypothetical protein